MHSFLLRKGERSQTTSPAVPHAVHLAVQRLCDLQSLRQGACSQRFRENLRRRIVPTFFFFEFQAFDLVVLSQRAYHQIVNLADDLDGNEVLDDVE